MSKISLLTAFGAGYVLGAKAGRGRYEQIRSRAQKVAENPRVQSATDAAKERAGEVAGQVVGVAKVKADEAATAVKETVQERLPGDGPGATDPVVTDPVTGDPITPVPGTNAAP